jgi:chemotaxis protein MotB
MIVREGSPVLCNKKSLAVGLMVVGAFLPSCVSSTKYRTLEDEHVKAREELEAAGMQLSEAEDQLIDAEGQKAALASKAAMADKYAAENAALQAKIDELSKGGTILTPDGTVLFTEDGKYGWRAQGDVVFAPGSDKLTRDGEKILTSVASELKKSGEPITVIGHTDSDPIVKTADKWKRGNIELGANRAISVKEFLVSQGLDESRIAITSYGPYKPLEAGKGADAKKKNRRVEIMTRLPGGPN